ncbi:MAG TPA: hypothetical protein VL053_18125 [Arachidicoccus sp.]|nr:hypothetical protein [Arachidicoccus sp.]
MLKTRLYFYTMPEYKPAWNDRTFIKTDRLFPSNKNCSCCGAQPDIEQDERRSRQ